MGEIFLNLLSFFSVYMLMSKLFLCISKLLFMKKILQILNNKKINSSDIKKIQKTIHLNNLSSHMLVMAKKK